MRAPQGLAIALQPNNASSLSTAGALADAVEALSALPDGAAILDALTDGDVPAVRARLDELSEQPDLPPRLAHHLALLMQRAARACEEREQTDDAESYWRRSWRCWLRYLATVPDTDARRIVLDFLLGRHRHRINELLARNAVDAARRHWNLVRELPAWAARVEEGLGRDLTERIEGFREELATEYLLTTREAMRFGAIPEGWRADYEKGLGYLRRLLSLDRDNPRLLAALIEICNDWFLDLYHLGDPPALRGQVERFTPFALQLARRIDERPGDLSARAALADFWKFRGFLVADRAAEGRPLPRGAALQPGQQQRPRSAGRTGTTPALSSRIAPVSANPFEILRLDPSSTEEEIVRQAGRLRQRATDEATLNAIRQAVRMLTARPEDRLLYSLLTHPAPCYHWPALDRFAAAFRRPPTATGAPAPCPPLDMEEFGDLVKISYCRGTRTARAHPSSRSQETRQPRRSADRRRRRCGRACSSTRRALNAKKIIRRGFYLCNNEEVVKKEVLARRCG